MDNRESCFTFANEDGIGYIFLLDSDNAADVAEAFADCFFISYRHAAGFRLKYQDIWCNEDYSLHLI